MEVGAAAVGGREGGEDGVAGYWVLAALDDGVEVVDLGGQGVVELGEVVNKTGASFSSRYDRDGHVDVFLVELRQVLGYYTLILRCLSV